MSTNDDAIRQIIIGILILLTATTILGATGWNFSQVAKIPDIYVKKSEIEAFEKTNREDHIAIQRKLDHLLELILEQRHIMFEQPTNSNVTFTYTEEDE